MKAFLSVGLAALLVAPGALAQEPGSEEPVPSDLTEEVEVRLVTVPILVTDKRGRPVTDLRLDEVEVREHGDQRRVAFLEPFRTRDTALPDPNLPPPDEAQPPPPPAAAPAGPEVRRIVFLFDVGRSRIPNRLKWAEGALQWVRTEMQPSDIVALAIFDTGIRYVVPFTSDRNLLESSLRDPYFLEGHHFDRRSQISELMDALTGCDEAIDQTSCATIAVETYLFAWEQETRQITQGLRSFVASLGAIPGRKMVIYGSEGFIRDPGTVAVNAILAEFGTDKMSFSDLSSRLRRDMSLDVLRLFSTGSAAGTAFFPIDVRSIADRDWVADAGEQYQLHERQLFNPMADVFDTSRAVLGSLANATGGRAYFGADAARRISEAIASSRGLYTVGYYGEAAIRASRDVKIKVKRRNVEVSDPSGAAPARPPRPLPADVAVLAPRPDGERAVVPVGVELDTALLPFEPGKDDTHVTQLSVYVALVDEGGAIAGEQFELVDVVLDAGQYRSRAVLPFRHVVRVPVAPGVYRVRVRVTDKDLAVRSDRVLPQEIRVGLPPQDEEAGAAAPNP